MAGTLNKGIELYVTTATCTTVPTFTPSTPGSSWTKLPHLQEIPDVGGTRDSVETTTFDDDAHTYIPGLISYGDALDFTFLHDKVEFASMKTKADGVSQFGWAVKLPDKTSATFLGAADVKVAGGGVNEALKDTLSVKPASEITITPGN